MSKVVLVRCESYESVKVKEAVQKGIELLGGPLIFIKPGEKILLKPNWIMAVPPEKCATTHPMVFKAVAELFQKAGAKITYGDSPGFSAPAVASQKTGFTDVASALGLTLADFQKGREIVFQGAIQNKILNIANGVLDSDGLISLPKLKNHAFLKITGAIKNQLGCVPGMLKGEYHVKLVNPFQFAQMLVDLNAYIRPRLYIMDGIMAMEGNGPMAGDPRKMNVLLFSSDPIALDATVCRMINVDPKLSYTVTLGAEAGLGTYLENEIELLGDPLNTFIDRQFNVNREPIQPFKSGNGFVKFINNMFVRKPYINKTKCVKCGICVKMCPVDPKAVDWRDGRKNSPPTYNYDRCIRCYCCQEICPEGAVQLKAPLLRRLFSKKEKNN
jgi:uncharacterized protein (DUF362 family)/Pyruvate/2-oxoacid:ferredoxin oxidoreductase delta subunit